MDLLSRRFLCDQNFLEEFYQKLVVSFFFNPRNMPSKSDTQSNEQAESTTQQMEEAPKPIQLDVGLYKSQDLIYISTIFLDYQS